MKAFKVFIILYVLILIALNTGHPTASPLVEPDRTHCHRVYPYGFFYVSSSGLTSLQANEAGHFRDPYRKVLPPSPFTWV